MRGLGLRLAINVAAVALIGLLVVDVAFVFWTQARISHERTLELRVAVLSAQVALLESAEAPHARFEVIAAQHEVEVSLRSPDGTFYSTAAQLELPAEVALREHVLEAGWEHLAIDVGAAGRVVASRRVDAAAQKALAMQRPALIFLGMVLVLMVFLGLIFLRRVVVQPLGRMTELIDRSDQEALSRFGSGFSDDFGRLSRSIISMTQRTDEDRKRIAWQLEELRAAHKDLSATQQQLVRAERLAVVGQLAAGVAHEIGNPLAVLSGYVDVLRDPELSPEDQLDAIGRMGRELDRISGTVRELLDFSRAPATTDEPASLRDVVEHVCRLLEPQDRLRQVSVEVGDVASDIVVAMDAGALTQVLLNLALNAADAINGKGRLRIDVSRQAGKVVIAVEDDGPGVAEEVRARIFEPFFTTKPAGEGTGLGLAVCEHIITAAGGELDVGHSDLGGAAFRVTLLAPELRGR